MAVKWTKQAIKGFKSGKTVSLLSKELKASQNTLRSVLKRELGEESYQELVNANSPKRSPVSRQQMVDSFHTEATFKSLAGDFNTSPNTLRKVWEEEFGKEAVKARSRKFHSAAGYKAGKAWKGKKRVSEETIRQRDVARGVDVWCPVCGKGCVGNQALVNHMTRAGHPEEAIEAARESIKQSRGTEKWEGKTKDVHYVVCEICGGRFGGLTSHLKTHGISGSEYRHLYGSSVFPSNVKKNREDKIQESATKRAYNFCVKDFEPYLDENGKLVVEKAAKGLGTACITILHYARSMGIPTRNKLSWQKMVLDEAATYLGEYKWEWSHPGLVSPATGNPFRYDGYFPKHNVILEAHGEQHFRYSENWHGTVSGFEAQLHADQLKASMARKAGFRVIVVRHSDVLDEAFWLSVLTGKGGGIWTTLSEKVKNRTVCEVLSDLRSGEYPTPTPNKGEVSKALTRLDNIRYYLDENNGVRPYSTAGTMACASFFPNRYESKRSNGLSVRQMWESDTHLKKAIRLQLDSGHPITPERVLKALIMFSKTPSVFRPAVAKFVYERYATDGVVWDPCAGYGGRLLGAFSARVRHYIGSDIESDTIEGNRKLSEVLGFETSLKQENCLSHVGAPNSLDLVFTSPPYFDLELYGTTFMVHLQEYSCVEDWADKFLGGIASIAEKLLKKGGHFALNLPSRAVDGCRLDQFMLERLNGRFFLIETLYLPVRTFKKGLKYEPILVWRKP